MTSYLSCPASIQCTHPVICGACVAYSRSISLWVMIKLPLAPSPTSIVRIPRLSRPFITCPSHLPVTPRPLLPRCHPHPAPPLASGGSITAGIFLDASNPASKLWPDWTMDTLAHHLTPAARDRLHSVNGAMCKWTNWGGGGVDKHPFLLQPYVRVCTWAVHVCIA